jgi:3-oxoadipate enol-lactonase
MKITSFDDTKIAVYDSGGPNRPAILFSHHMGGNAAFWNGQDEALRADFRIIRYDSRGHGASDAPPGPYTAAMLGRDAHAVLAALDIGQAHFVGISQGGMAGMWLAARHPEKVDRLVLANTTPFVPNKAPWDGLIARARAEGMAAIASETIGGWLSDGFKRREPAKVEAMVAVMAAMKVEGYAGACAMLRDVDLRPVLEQIEAPTLVIGGAEDGPRGAAGPLMAEAIPGATLQVLPGAAHLSAVENPAAFNRALREHLG